MTQSSIFFSKSLDPTTALFRIPLHEISKVSKITNDVAAVGVSQRVPAAHGLSPTRLLKGRENPYLGLNPSDGSDSDGEQLGRHSIYRFEIQTVRKFATCVRWHCHILHLLGGHCEATGGNLVFLSKRRRRREQCAQEADGFNFGRKFTIKFGLDAELERWQEDVEVRAELVAPGLLLLF